MRAQMTRRLVALTVVAAAFIASSASGQNARNEAALQRANEAALANKGSSARAGTMRAAGEAQDSAGADQRNQALEKAARQGARPPINLPSPADESVRVNVDPARIARQYAEIQSGKARREDDTNEVMVFVSLSMPKDSLVRVARDSRRVKGMLVMNGSPYGVGKGMWLRSVDALKPMTDVGGAISLHPDAFERYGIKRVPAVVVAPDPQAGCTEDACREYAVVYGDVSLDYALERLADRKDAIGAIARDRLKRLSEGAR